MKIRLLIILFVFTKLASAQTWVVIPDAHLVTYLQSIIPSAMNGDSLNISSTLVTTTTHKINVANKGIANLSGVQYFSSLDTLNFGNTGAGPSNTVTNIPALPNSLTYLNFYANNNVSSLPALPNTLTYLNCGGNNFSSLPALPTSLKYFNCSFNNLTTLPTIPSTLTYLNCFHNHLPNLPTLGNLITYLSCGDNHILTSLPALPTSLRELECGANNLSSLPALPNSLQVLICNSNPLTSLPALPNSLTYIDCDTDSLTSLPTLPNSLLTLGCGTNYLTSLPALPNSLTNLDCELNLLTSLPILPDSLTSFWCDSNNIICFPVFPNSLVDTNYFNIAGNPYNCLPNYVTGMGTSYLAKPLCAAGNTNGCPVAAMGIKQVTSDNFFFNLYPNPAKETITVQSTNELGLVSIYNAIGQLIMQQQTKETNLLIDLSNQAAGFYFVKVENQYIKLIKE